MQIARSKLGEFGKFTVRSGPGIDRKIPFAGETKMTEAARKIKLVARGQRRASEKF